MRQILLAAAIVVPGPAVAEVKSAAADGFETVNAATVAASPDQVFAALGQPRLWWNSAHTYSGDSANLTLEPRAGGCFCENVPADGSTIEHGRVVYVQPGRSMRLRAALGPLQGEGVSAALTWTLKPVAGGVEITQTYVVGGFVRGGADKLAPIVDRVLGEQLNGLQAYLARR